MMRAHRLEHQFVSTMPDFLTPGVLYISMEYATSSHTCCCGCGQEVVTPFTPTDWKMTFDGESISLWPSVGNWNLRCRSHYIIDHGHVRWAGSWSEAQIEAERRRDKAAKAVYYDSPKSDEISVPATVSVVEESIVPNERWLWRRLKWLFRK